MTTHFAHTYIRRHIALPGEHGAWVFLLSPLLIGVFAGGRWTPGLAYLSMAAVAVFLIRQPITIVIKAYAGRRSKRDLAAAWFWIAIYGLLALLAIIALISSGNSYILFLALPGVPVFIWHLKLVSRRSERGQASVEVLASGVLALAAPAGYWVALGKSDPTGWWLFGLSWAQSAASIVYTYLRLYQRELPARPFLLERLRLGFRAILFTSFNLAIVGVLSWIGVLPSLLAVPYLLQWMETLWGTLKPAVGLKPTSIGLRQLTVSTLFTVLFILTWSLK